MTADATYIDAVECTRTTDPSPPKARQRIVSKMGQILDLRFAVAVLVVLIAATTTKSVCGMNMIVTVPDV